MQSGRMKKKWQKKRPYIFDICFFFSTACKVIKTESFSIHICKITHMKYIKKADCRVIFNTLSILTNINIESMKYQYLKG